MVNAEKLFYVTRKSLIQERDSAHRIIGKSKDPVELRIASEKFKVFDLLVKVVEEQFDAIINSFLKERTERIILLPLNGRMYVYEKTKGSYLCVPDFAILGDKHGS